MALKYYLTAILLSLIEVSLLAQVKPMTGTPSEIDFSMHLRDWDGFGFNYVQTAHSYDYDSYPQDYGGFSLLNEKQRQEIAELVFGEDGLKLSLLKMFLDPLHQSGPAEDFDHELSTKWMLDFAHRGDRIVAARGGNLEIITTLYGPPGWTTMQGFDQGRDLNPEYRDALANYMVDWVAFLVNREKLEVKYLSLHNEGEDWLRWAWSGKEKGIFDYNLFWPHDQINDFLIMLPGKLQARGLEQVGLSNGETANWYRFHHWGYASALLQNDLALSKLSLITSHGFYAEVALHRWYGDHESAGIDMLRESRPELHSWVTSTSWGGMDALFAREIHGNIYGAKVNAIIPWAGIQRPAHWEGGDPNSGTAIRVLEDSSYHVLKAYYLYKQFTRAGQPGMAVSNAWAMETQAPIVAFSSNGTDNPDAFILINWSDKWNKSWNIRIKGSEFKSFKVYQTDGEDKNYLYLGDVEVLDGILQFEAEPGTVTTFFGTQDHKK